MHVCMRESIIVSIILFMFLKYSLADASGCLPIPSFYALLALCFYYYVFVYAIFLNVPIKIIIIIIIIITHNN